VVSSLSYFNLIENKIVVVEQNRADMPKLYFTVQNVPHRNLSLHVGTDLRSKLAAQHKSAAHRNDSTDRNKKTSREENIIYNSCTPMSKLFTKHYRS
jgi:hypothetical protein